MVISTKKKHLDVETTNGRSLVCVVWYMGWIEKEEENVECPMDDLCPRLAGLRHHRLAPQPAQYRHQALHTALTVPYIAHTHLSCIHYTHKSIDSH